MKKLVLIILLYSAGSFQQTFAQKQSYPNVDSLHPQLSESNVDTNTVRDLLELSKRYFSTEPDTAMKYAEKAKLLAEKLKYPWGIGYALKNIGIVHNLKGNYISALQNWKKAMHIFETNDIKIGTANMLNNIGVIYYNKSLETEALDYYLKSLKISEELNDTLRIATALINIGAVYSNKESTYRKTIEFDLRALPLCEAINDEIALGNCLANLGEIYYKWQKYDSALFYLRKAQIVVKESETLPFTLNSIGKVLRSIGDYDSALTYQRQAFNHAEKLDAKNDMGQSLLEMGKTYSIMKKYSVALQYFKQGEKIFRLLGSDATYDLKETYEGISHCYSELHNFNNAFKYQSFLLGIKDSLYNLEVDKKLGTKLFAFEIDKKQNEIDLQDEVISKQKLIRNGFIGGFIIVLLFAGIIFRQRNRIGKEKKRSDELLLNILPEEIAEELKLAGIAKAKSFDKVTVILTDFKAFTIVSELLSPQELVDELHTCFSEFDKIIYKHNIEKIKTVGDAYLAVCGLPLADEKHAENVVNAAMEIREFMEKRRQNLGNKTFEIRIGINSGSVVAGIVGVKKFAYDIWGDTVNTAARMEQNSDAGKINISETTYQLVKDIFICEYRGEIDAKNKGKLKMYYVDSNKQ